MGGETTTQQSSTQVRATPEEEELNRLALERARASQGGQIQAQESGLNLVNQLLTGQDLPGFLQGLPGGISPDVTQNIVDRSLEDVQFGLQASGLLDSGTRAELEARTAADIRTQAEQFNIGNLLQLLNLGVGGQAQVQAPIQGGINTLSQSLAGLRGTSGQASVTAPNPFLSNFQSSLGKSFGSPSASFGPSGGTFGFGG